MKHNFRRLDIWNSAMDLAEKTYQIVKTVPNDERFGLKSQLTRAAVSIPSNIAEGSGRNSRKEFSQFISISIGSAYELETQLILLNRLFNIETEDLVEHCRNLERMMTGFRTKLVSIITEV